MSSTTEIENRPIASQTENNLSIEAATLRAMELETVAQVSAAVSTILNLDQLLQEVVDLVKDRFGLYHVHIYLLDSSKEQLTLAAGAGEPGRLMLAQGHRIALNRKQSLVASAARLREGVVVNDVTLEPNFLPNVYLPNTRSEMAIPLILADEVIGVLDVQSESVGRFSADDVRVKTILGQQIAVAVRNARVFELTQHQLRLQEANLTIAEFFRDTELTVEEGLERALNVILDVFRADNVTMLAYDNQNQNWNEDAWAGVEIPQIVSVSGAGAYPHATQAFETGQVVVVEDTRRHPDFPPELLVKEPGVKSSLALPLVVGGTIRKVFVVNYLSRLHLFAAEELSAARVMAEEIARDITIREAEIHLAEERYATERLANDLQVVQEVGATISTILDLDTMLQEVVDLTKERFQLYHAHIYLLDEAEQSLKLTAGAGDAGRMMKKRGHSISLNHPSSIVARTARTRQGGFVNDVTQSPDFLPNPLLPRTRSENTVPMVVNERLVGVLDVQSERVGRFNDIDVSTKTALAQEIAVAVENARAFENLVQAQNDLALTLQAQQQAEAQMRRRASELETVGIVSATISTILNSEELLDTVADLTKDSFGLYHAHIYLLDETRENLVLVAGAGEPGRIMKSRGHHIPYNHPNSLVARTARSSHGVIVNDVTQEPSFLPNPLLPDTRSEMVVPLIVGSDLIGVLDVQADKVGHFTDDDMLVESTLAAQIAVAVQNARALEQIILHERAMENSSSGLTIADARKPGLPIIYVNPAFEKITGYSAEEVRGQHLLFLESNTRDGHVLADLRTMMGEGEESLATLRIYRKDGTEFWDELSLSPIRNAQGEVTHYVGGHTDITERKDLEAQRELMLRQVEEQAQRDRETAERLLDVDRLKSQFLANMSHELRTPLNSIIGYSEILLDGDDGELNEDALEDVETIHQSGRHLLSIINEILDLAKIESGQLTLDRRAVDLNAVVAEVVNTAQVLVKGKSVELKAVEESPTDNVYADVIRLRQIITNLVSNAVKFTEQGSVTVAFGAADNFSAYVEVRDTGIGMKKEDLEVIFQQFQQVDGSATRRAGGTGLGLTITRHLVDLHEGMVTVDSEQGVGSTFRVVLPLFQPEEVSA